jgi:hypothetical protein
MKITGRRRLAIFLSTAWVFIWLLMYMTDPIFPLMPFLLVGVSPVAIAWGIWWVWCGFRQNA